MHLDNPAIQGSAPAGQSTQTGRALVPFTNVTDLVRSGPVSEGLNQTPEAHQSLTDETARLLNVRSISPSEMTEISLDLYAMGLISFDDYSALAYHPELHPEYDRTIGALTGEAAAPGRKRDFISDWEEKYRFLKRHCPENNLLVEQSKRITNLLHSLAGRMICIY